MTERLGLMDMRIKKMPPIVIFTGDIENRVSPLEQYYTVAADLICVHGGRVFIDTNKIHVCPQDAEYLYTLLRRFMSTLEGEEGAKKAAHIWSQLSPREVRDVPIGHAIIEIGCFYIKPDRIVSPLTVH